jgi:hypothetical protein
MYRVLAEGYVLEYHIRYDGLVRVVGRGTAAARGCTGDKQPAAKPGATAAAAGSRTARCLQVLQAQVGDGDITGIDEQASLGAAAVEPPESRPVMVSDTPA